MSTEVLKLECGWNSAELRKLTPKHSVRQSRSSLVMGNLSDGREL